MKNPDDLFVELKEEVQPRPEESGIVKALDIGVHFQGKKIIEEAGEVWLTAECESDEAPAEGISQLLYWLQVAMVDHGLSLEGVYKYP